MRWVGPTLVLQWGNGTWWSGPVAEDGDQWSRRGHQCSKTALTGIPSFSVSASCPLWVRNSAPCWGKQMVDPLDQWGCVRNGDCRTSTGLSLEIIFGCKTIWLKKNKCLIWYFFINYNMEWLVRFLTCTHSRPKCPLTARRLKNSNDWRTMNFKYSFSPKFT